MAWAHHVVDTRPQGCPSIADVKEVSDDVEELKKELRDALFFVRHPKLAMVVMAIIVAGLLVSAWGTFRAVSINDKNVELVNRIEQIEKKLQ